MLYYTILPFAAAFSLFFCIQRSRGFSVSNLILKTVSSLCFLLTGVAALIENNGAYIYGGLLIFGGILGLVGDVLLDLKGIYKQDEHTYLLGGFIAFLVGHIFYSTAIIQTGTISTKMILLCFVGAVIFSVGNLGAAKIMKQEFGRYKLIVSIYVVFLALTMLLSIACMFTSHFEKKYVLLAVGAVSFTLSDVVLSGTYFGKGQDTGFFYFINHFLYYAGQYLIASSIMFM